MTTTWLKTRRFTAKVTQEVQSRLANVRAVHDLDLGDDGGVGREDSLDADAVADLSDREARELRRRRTTPSNTWIRSLPGSSVIRT